MTTTVSVDVDLAREIYGRLLSQGWRKTMEFWSKKESQVSAQETFSAEIQGNAGDKVIEAINIKGISYMIFKTKLRHGRVWDNSIN